MTSKDKMIYHQTIQCEHFHHTSEDISRLATTPAVEFSVDLRTFVYFCAVSK